jgi:hypothetical protein
MDSTLTLISGAISLIVLIIFFYMASNLSEVKKELQQANSTQSQLDKSRAIAIDKARIDYYKNKNQKNYHLAIDNILTIIFSQLIDKKLNDVMRKKRYEDLRVMYEQHLMSVGGTFPEYPFVSKES